MEEINQPNDRYREIKAQPSEAAIEKLRYYQDFNFAIVGGLIAAILCALVWAFITVGTGFQIGYMAVGLGFAVGMSVRYFGAGVDAKFGYAGMVISLFGCLLGNFLSQVGFVAESYSQGYFETLTYFEIGDIPSVIIESFHPMDLIFYGIAVYEGHRFAFRPIPGFISEADDLTPPFGKFRLPLTVVSLLVIGFVAYGISQGTSGVKTFFYESGSRMSEGEVVNGKLNGMWNYWYENGQIKLQANYINDLEDSTWKWFNEDGSLIQVGDFKKGLQHGKWINYYPGSIVLDSGQYYNGRQKGTWAYFYEKGNLSSVGDFERDLKTGIWKTYHENGKISTVGRYEKNSNVGIWQSWDSSGNLIEEIEFMPDGNSKIIFACDKNRKPTVKNGTGTYKTFYEDGSIMQTGTIKNGGRSGIWVSYYQNGFSKEEGEFLNGIYKLLNSWDKNGKRQIINGNGDFTSYYEETISIYESGNYKDGLKSGSWKIFSPDNNKIMQEINFVDGKMSGNIKLYYENGNVYMKGLYADDKKDGEWKWYFESGNIESSVRFNAGEKEGVQTFWSESGEKLKEEFYKNGMFIKEEINSSL
jgi:antitoxin component YwqK of YwqJK toxin-antitoxin module